MTTTHTTVIQLVHAYAEELAKEFKFTDQARVNLNVALFVNPNMEEYVGIPADFAIDGFLRDPDYLYKLDHTTRAQITNVIKQRTKMVVQHVWFLTQAGAKLEYPYLDTFDAASLAEVKPEFKDCFNGCCINLPDAELLRAIYASLPELVPRLSEGGREFTYPYKLITLSRLSDKCLVESAKHQASVT